MKDYGNGWGHGPRILSRPIPVVFQGWRSTTLELQAAGWELSTQYAAHEDMYHLAVSNPQLQIVGRTTQPIFISQSLKHHYDRNDPDLPTFYVSYLTHKVRVFEHHNTELPPMWHRIDAQTQLAQMEIKDLHDMCHFAPWDKSTEVLVAAADMEVVELLRIIVDKQQPKQKELRERSARAPKIERISRILEVA